WGWSFDEDDFHLETITHENCSPYTLKAHPASLRWVGQIDIPLVRQVDLAEVGVVTELRSLSESDFSQHLDVPLIKPFTSAVAEGSILVDLTRRAIQPDDQALFSILDRVYADTE